jgi:hypothetical protein
MESVYHLSRISTFANPPIWPHPVFGSLRRLRR